jgi:hypothetical protein
MTGPRGHIFIALGDWSPLRVAGDTEHAVARLSGGPHLASRHDDLVEVVRPVDDRPVRAFLDELDEEEVLLAEGPMPSAARLPRRPASPARNGT